MDHKEREVLIGEIMWWLVEELDRISLSVYLNDPMHDVPQQNIELVKRRYQVQRRTAKEWLGCAVYLIRELSDIHEAV